MKKTETIEEKLLYREPMLVTEMRILGRRNAFPVCPRCNITIERDYQAFCDRCGQMLKWNPISKLKIEE